MQRQGHCKTLIFIAIITSQVNLWPESLPEQKAVGTTDRDENDLPIQLIYILHKAQHLNVSF